jgi:putative integral membrane protein (TIGR02587 family)
MRSAETLRGVGRAFGGALLFAVPILLTMEMWSSAVTIPPWRLAVLVLTDVALVVGLSRYFGLVSGSGLTWYGAFVDAGVALLVGFLTAAVALRALGVIHPLTHGSEALSMVILEALPAAIGASFARGQLGQRDDPKQGHSSYLSQIFLMAAGAVVFAASIAPTAEVVLSAASIDQFGVLLLAALELALMHAFVYNLGFRGGSTTDRFWSIFGAYTVTGYACALGVSAYLLWIFGRFTGTAAGPAVAEVVVLALPASIGAAGARLVL